MVHICVLYEDGFTYEKFVDFEKTSSCFDFTCYSVHGAIISVIIEGE